MITIQNRISGFLQSIEPYSLWSHLPKLSPCIAKISRDITTVRETLSRKKMHIKILIS